MREIIEVGALLRRNFRRLCLELGLSIQEDKGFWDSQFIVEGSQKDMEALYRAIQERQDRMAG